MGIKEQEKLQLIISSMIQQAGTSQEGEEEKEGEMMDCLTKIALTLSVLPMIKSKISRIYLDPKFH